MPAHFIKRGEPAHDAELQALRFLVENLPDSCTVLGNPWLVERSGQVYELDAVVVAPHAIFVVEIKCYRGAVEGTDFDWFVNDRPIRSPLALNRKTAQILHSLLERNNYTASRVWVQGLVFLSAATTCGVRGPASRQRVRTRADIIRTITSPAVVRMLSGRTNLAPVDLEVENAVLHVLEASRKTPRPARVIREYEILERLDQNDRFIEYLGRHRQIDENRVLRVYRIPPLASEADRKAVQARVRWEAQVLARLGRGPFILKAELPFDEEEGIVLPLEQFAGVSLSTWLERHGKQARGHVPRAELWLKAVRGIRHAHDQGVVHRLLRPEVVLVADRAQKPDLRITGFDLAKQMRSAETVHRTTLGDERLRFAAPEVIAAFSDAQPASDQFSLGALLGLLLTGRPLFDNTQALMRQKRLITRVRDLSPRVPAALDAAVTRMVALRPADRFPDLAAAQAAVREALRPTAVTVPLLPEDRPALDPDDLPTGVRVGRDYEILGRLGEGGMAVVYAARHLVSGRTRALKIARNIGAAEAALRHEFEVLDTLSCPNIGKVIDLSNVVEGRLTMVMERVGGRTLRSLLAEAPVQEPNTQRRLAEDLMTALEHLEQQGVVHKDLKPENLLVGEAGLTVIDFSLAGAPAEDMLCGTARYRDPNSDRWSHATDRYAAALCLFELYAGRHAFDGGAPEPGQVPAMDEAELDPSGLAAFFRKALHPSPGERFPSTHMLREAFRAALGRRTTKEEEEPGAPGLEHLHMTADMPLGLTGLSTRATGHLRRAGVSTVGELLALHEPQLRSIHAIGAKTIEEVQAFQEEARRQGVQPAAPPSTTPEVLGEHLTHSPEALSTLSLGQAVLEVLSKAGFRTVGQLAGVSREDLLRIPGIGRSRLAQVVDALARVDEEMASVMPGTMDALWDRACRALAEEQKLCLERWLGISGEPVSQKTLAKELKASQGRLSHICSAGLERLDRGVLGEPLDLLEALLDGVGGLIRLEEAGERLEGVWAADTVQGAGLVRLLQNLHGIRFKLMDLDGVEGSVLCRPQVDRAELERFVGAVLRLGRTWPPQDAATARRTLEGLVAGYAGDTLALATRLVADVQLSDRGELFSPPVDPDKGLLLVLEREKLPATLTHLRTRVEETFGGMAPFPEGDLLIQVLRQGSCQLREEMVLREGPRSVEPGAVEADPLPDALLRDRPHEQVVGDMLREASSSRGFRMLVVPPEQMNPIGRSAAAALPGATYVSFEDVWFTEHGDGLRRMERAERFAAQRRVLTRSVESVMGGLLQEHGRPDRTVVLGETGLWGVCEALDQVRRLYDETQSGERGFWVLVLPGIIRKRQPLFNETQPVWHLPGVTLPLMHAIPGGSECS